MRLIVEQGSLAGQEFAPTEPVVSIGRSAESGLVLRDDGVSRHHAHLQREPRGWLLTDEGSTNGTYVNGQRLPPHEPYLLRAGDRIALGSAVLAVYEAGPAVEPGVPMDGDAEGQPRRVHPALMAVGALVLLVVLAGAALLLVMVLRPAPGPPTPTAGEPLQQMLTALPLPTGFDQIVTDVVPLLPTDLSLPFFGTTATPVP